MDIKNAKEKIQKLLALSGSDNDHESYAALAMAQKLMAEYKISEKELSPKEVKKCVKRKTTFSYGTRSSNYYLQQLADIIAGNFCCLDFFTHASGKSTRYIWFMGMEDDVNLCEEAMRTASMAISDGINRVWKELKRDYDISYVPTNLWTPAKLGYVKGYLKGLHDIFEEQKAQHQEWGLVLVVPEEAKKYAGSLTHASLTSNQTRADATYFQEGVKDGRNFNMNKKLDGKGDYILDA